MMEKYEIQKLRELPIEKVAKEMGMKVEHPFKGCDESKAIKA